ncbi:hypothetical protein FGI21_00430 [Dickeya zeae]|uniref:Uncharacterized protein n=1 Tax=Dickeya zeae TaxID=204042 RepID=A0ABX8VRA1_9GAMM|nr:hypothetical protein FGI21_00430 [Dickeya zeae]
MRYHTPASRSETPRLSIRRLTGVLIGRLDAVFSEEIGGVTWSSSILRHRTSRHRHQGNTGVRSVPSQALRVHKHTAEGRHTEIKGLSCFRISLLTIGRDKNFGACLLFVLLFTVMQAVC